MLACRRQYYLLCCTPESRKEFKAVVLCAKHFGRTGRLPRCSKADKMAFLAMTTFVGAIDPECVARVALCGVVWRGFQPECLSDSQFLPWFFSILVVAGVSRRTRYFAYPDVDEVDPCDCIFGFVVVDDGGGGVTDPVGPLGEPLTLEDLAPPARGRYAGSDHGRERLQHASLSYSPPSLLSPSSSHPLSEGRPTHTRLR